MGRHSLLSLSCFAAAGAWPTIFIAISNSLMSPLERAVRESICGTPLHSAPELLDHCVACWAGSAILAATGIFVFMANTNRPARVRTY